MFLFLGFVFRFHCTRVECWNFLSFFFLISYLVFRLHGIDAAAKTKKWRVFFEKKTRKKMETTESTSSMPSSFFFGFFFCVSICYALHLGNGRPTGRNRKFAQKRQSSFHSSSTHSASVLPSFTEFSLQDFLGRLR